MFTAETIDGQKYSLADTWTRNELEHIRFKEQLFCPICKQAVQMKLGNQRLWHFAHLADKECKLQLENETEYHLAGKKKLYTWLFEQGLKAELECYLPKIKQRPDILVDFNGSRYAIEFQCSSIPNEQLISRTLSYKRERIVPIWIIGGSRLKRQSQFLLKPANYELLMTFQTPKDNLLLIFFCPLTNKFALSTSLNSFSSNSLVTHTSYYSLPDITLQKIINYESNIPQANMNTSWLTLKRTWRTSGFLYTEHYWKEWFYKQGMYLSLLPAEVGLPVPSMLWIKTNVMIWQGWILVKFIQPLKVGEHVSFHQIYKEFNVVMRKGKFNVRKLPCVYNSHYSFAIMNYLQVLTNIGVLRKTGVLTEFQKIKPLTYPINTNIACEWDASMQNHIGI